MKEIDKVEIILRQETLRLHELYSFPDDYAIPSISRQSISVAELIKHVPGAFTQQTVLEIGPYRTAAALLYKQLGASKVRIIDGQIPDMDIMERIYKEENIEFCRINFTNETCYESLSVADKNDLVVCMEVIEHFNFNPIPFLQWISSLLCPGGLLFLTVPNQTAILNRVRLFAGKSIETPVDYFIEQMRPGNTKMHGIHWREYTLTDVKKLLSYCGFEEIKSGYIGLQDYKHKNGLIKNIGRKLASYHTTLYYLGSPAQN